MKTQIPRGTLSCPACQATVRNISKERGRFLRRHPQLCQRFKAFVENAVEKKFSKQLASDTKSVDADVPSEFGGRQV